MKELKSFKEPKKTPGQFKKAKKRNKNIQHNRDQLKLLKEQKLDQVELYILDNNIFKRVTIMSGDPAAPEELFKTGDKVVYLAQNGKKSKLRTGFYVDKRGSCLIYNVGFIKWEHCLGLVIKEEIIKEYV